MTAWEIHIFGKVQGVWYRKFVETHALKAGIKGWVKNETDGSVLARVEHADEGVLEELMHRCSEGPEHARVDRIEVRHVPAEGFTDFTILR